VIAKQAIYKLVEQTSGVGNPGGIAKEKILIIMKERDNLKKKMEETQATGGREVILWWRSSRER